MKKLLLSLTCSFVLLSFCNAQWGNKKGHISGDGNVTTEARNLGAFSEVNVGDGIDVYITQANENKVEVEADANLISEIRTEVKGGALHIYANKYFKRVKKLQVNVWVKDIKGIKASGGSDVYSNGTIKANKMHVRGSGGSDITLALEVDELHCSVSGGSDADLEGSANHAEMSASGGSDIKAYGLKASVCEISASGGSDAYVTAMSEIHLSASGGSDVHYKGDAKVVRKSVSGSSDIHH